MVSYIYPEYEPDDGEVIELAIRDDRVESDVFVMPDGDFR